MTKAWASATRALALGAALLLGALAAPPARADEPLRILAIGDSLMAWHNISSRSIAHELGRALGTRVQTRAVSAARIFHFLPITGELGLSIPKQFRKRDEGYDWVVVTGGGNDLWLGCGCGQCDRMIERLVSADGAKGRVPKLVRRIRATGAKVLWIGYLRSPGFLTPIESCKDEGDAYEARLAAMAARDEGVFFLSIADLVPEGDKSFHALDRIHPSLKASRAIGQLAAEIIAAN